MVRKAVEYQRSKQSAIYVERFLTLHIFCSLLIDYAWDT